MRMELNAGPRSASLPLNAASVLVRLAVGMRPVPVKFQACISPDFPQPSASLFKVSMGLLLPKEPPGRFPAHCPPSPATTLHTQITSSE